MLKFRTEKLRARIMYPYILLPDLAYDLAGMLITQNQGSDDYLFDGLLISKFCESFIYIDQYARLNIAEGRDQNKIEEVFKCTLESLWIMLIGSLFYEALSIYSSDSANIKTLTSINTMETFMFLSRYCFGNSNRPDNYNNLINTIHSAVFAITWIALICIRCDSVNCADVLTGIYAAAAASKIFQCVPYLKSHGLFGHQQAEAVAANPAAQPAPVMQIA